MSGRLPRIAAVAGAALLFCAVAPGHAKFVEETIMLPVELVDGRNGARISQPI